MIPYGRQDIDAQDIEAVVQVLKSDFLTQGPKVPEFESKLASYTGAKFAVAMNSATSALHAACLALGVGPESLVWTSPITFVASSNAALYCGAKVDFVDIDSKTYNMCPQKLEEKLILAKKQGRLPKVVIPVHLAGQSCDMERIHQLGKQYGFSIIEDASHAVGGKYKNRSIGNCDYSDITILSFHPVKIITTAEGGAALTNDPKLFKALNLFRSHGITRDQNDMVHESHGPWYYEQIELGYNYRMTDIHAALGSAQMNRLDDFIEKRHAVADFYFKSNLKNLPVVLPYQDSDTKSAYHLFILKLKLDDLKLGHKEIFIELRNAGIGVNLHYIPVYLQPYYSRLGFKPGYCPEAESYYKSAISIPMYSALNQQSKELVVEKFTSILK